LALWKGLRPHAGGEGPPRALAGGKYRSICQCSAGDQALPADVLRRDGCVTRHVHAIRTLCGTVGKRPFCDQADRGQSFPLYMGGHRAALRVASAKIKSRRQMSAHRAVEQCAFGLAAAIGRGVGGRTDGGHAHPDRGIGMKVGPWSNAQTALGGARRWAGMMACGQTDPSGAKSTSTRAGEASTSRQASETASRRSAATDRGITRWRPCVA